MKTTTKLLLGGAILAATGVQVANAQITTPSSENSQLLFVLDDLTSGDSGAYVASLDGEDITATGGTATTGGSIFTSANAASGAGKGGTFVTPTGTIKSFSFNLASIDPRLTSFIALHPSDSYQWLLMGAATNTGTLAASRDPTGNTIAVVTAQTAASITGVSLSSFFSATGVVTGAASHAQAVYNATTGGEASPFTTFSTFKASEPTGYFCQPGVDTVNGNCNFYGSGVTAAGTAINTSQELYAMATNGAASGFVTGFDLGKASFNGSVLSFVSNSVPLPAAVWLFGSGLLGLIGIGRRRAAAAAA